MSGNTRQLLIVVILVCSWLIAIFLWQFTHNIYMYYTYFFAVLMYSLYLFFIAIQRRKTEEEEILTGFPVELTALVLIILISILFVSTRLGKNLMRPIVNRVDKAMDPGPESMVVRSVGCENKLVLETEVNRTINILISEIGSLRYINSTSVYSEISNINLLVRDLDWGIEELRQCYVEDSNQNERKVEFLGNQTRQLINEIGYVLIKVKDNKTITENEARSLFISIQGKGYELENLHDELYRN